MTEPGHESWDDPDSGPSYSKDYWDQVFDQLGKRKLFKLAMVVLALLYGVAIYAPLLANDRPYFLEAVSYQEYGKARKTLFPVTMSIGDLLQKGPDEYLASRTEGSDQTYMEALQAEGSLARRHVETMKSYLAGAHGTAKLDAFLVAIDSSVVAGIAGNREGGQKAAGEAKALVKEVRDEFTAVDPDDPAAGGLALKPLRSYPLRDAISAVEFFFMVLWALVLTWPLWNLIVNRVLLRGDRDRIRIVRRRKFVAVLALAVIGGVVWKFAVDGSMTFESSSFKDHLTQGQIVPERALFPPLSFGFAESNSGENFRPPTWVANAEISEEGYYVRGPLVPKPDPITGYLPPPAPVEQRFSEPAVNSGWRHPIGTDSVGRDMLVRLVWGSRVSLSVGLVSAALLVFIGTIVGAIAGYFGGKVDIVLSRLIEVILCFPAFFLILMVVAFTDPDVVPPIISIVVVIALVRWTGVARLARAEFLRLRALEFTLAARALGASSFRTIFRHILPNAIGPILVAGAFSVAAGILTESALSFLGFGVKDPIPSWGSLVNESRSAEHWWIQVFPGLLIFVTVVCYNLVGDAIRDAVDPKMKL